VVGLVEASSPPAREGVKEQGKERKKEEKGQVRMERGFDRVYWESGEGERI